MHFLKRHPFKLLTFIFLTLISVGTLSIRRALFSTAPEIFSKETGAVSNPVRITFDSYGVPTVSASTLEDALFTQGYVTARDRSFKMDLVRRKMSGRLAELLGPLAVSLDKEARLYNFTKVADDTIKLMPADIRKFLEAYASGVNLWTGKHVSFEMKLLGYKPDPWLPRDSILAVLSMFQALDSYENVTEFARTSLLGKLPKSAVDFISLNYGFLDAPFFPDPKTLPLPAPPSPTEFNVREPKSRNTSTSYDFQDRDFTFGSNGWAVSGKLTESGVPLLAGDPHLDLNVPNIWYRTRLELPDFHVTGVALPGVPGIVIGTNGNIAWTFTNANADTVDFVPIDPTIKNDFPLREEKIRTRFFFSKTMKFRDTPYGPMNDQDTQPLATQWAALDSKALSTLDLIGLNSARNLSEATKALSTWAGPVQNCMLATKDGHVGWILVGKSPSRVGFDGRESVPRDSRHYWNGYIPFSQMPKVIDPPSGFIANANQRTAAVDGTLYQIANDWLSPARAYRIGELLSDGKKRDAKAQMDIQLDILSHTHLWYRDRLLEVLSKTESTSWLIEIRSLIQDWDGLLSLESSAYPFLKEFRRQVFETFLDSFTRGLDKDDIENIRELFFNQDSVIQELLTRKPMNLLDPKFTSYEDFLRSCALKAAKKLAYWPGALKDLRWGKINQADFQHPLTKLFPFVLNFLNMPPRELSGDSLVPRVAKPTQGASMRMVIDLQDSSKSLFAQPGGQSGHPFSKHYRDLYDAWVEGKAIPFEPGAPVSSMVLESH